MQPARYQPVVGLKEKGDIMEDLLAVVGVAPVDGMAEPGNVVIFPTS
jgi:hypothetical protein